MMKPRRVLMLCGGTLVLVAACRSGGPRPRGAPESAPPVTPAAIDTTSTGVVPDSVLKAREDSIRAATETPTTPAAAAPVAEVPPKIVTADPPERRCILDLTNVPDVTRATRVIDPVTGKAFVYVGGGLVGTCRGENIHITADSAESYEANDLHILIGNVHYREEKYTITSKRATYFKAEERLVFQDSVHAVMTKDAATLDGPELEYLRPVRGLRARSRVVATRRPQLTYIEKDSAGRDQPPVVVLGNTIIGEGDSTFVAVGNVHIQRSDVTATGDSALFDGARRYSRLMKNPVVQSKGEDPFTLKGVVIDMYGESKQLDRVVAIDSANAVSKDFNVVSDTIDLRLSERKLTRAFAFGPSGGRATTPDRDIIADSLDIVMPNQKIRELRGVGKAFAESDPDTTRIKSDERDWMRGDTLIALFDSLAPADTSQPEVRELFASGQASAFYQVPDTSDRSKPGINYVTGRVIRLTFKEKEVDAVTVTDQVSGIYLTPAPADTSARRPPGTRPPDNTPRRPPAIRPPAAGARRP